MGGLKAHSTESSNYGFLMVGWALPPVAGPRSNGCQAGCATGNAPAGVCSTLRAIVWYQAFWTSAGKIRTASSIFDHRSST
jgi:hypothetical protein